MVRKLKVTKRVAAKPPWYERPPLLFGAIGAVLLVSGILMANLTSRTARNAGALGQATHTPAATPGAEASPGATQTPASTPPGSTDPGHLLDPSAPLPPIAAGECGPPLAADTRHTAALARTRMREARSLGALTADGGREGALFAHVAVENLVTRATQGASPAQLWESLELHPGFDPLTDIELQRDAEGHLYVAGFVSRQVGDALGALGPGLPLTPAPPVTKAPAWQFWKRSGPAGAFELHQGSVISIYPDLNPEAECYVVLPLDRARPTAVRTVRAALERPQYVLEVALN